MKKLLTLIVLLLVCTCAAWLGTSWFIGVKTEELVRRQLEQNDADLPHTHTLIDYQSTLFGAKAITLMDVRDTPLSAWVDELQLIHEIKNGPVFWKGDFDSLQTGLSEWRTKVDTGFFEEHVRETVKTAFAGAEPIQISSMLGFDRIAGYQMKISPVSSTTEGGQEFLLDGALISGKFDTKNKVLDEFNLTTDLLAFTNDVARLSLPDLSVARQGNAELNAELKFKADQVSLLIVGEPEPIQFNLNGKSAQYNQDEDLRGDFNITLDTFSGVQYPLKRVGLDFEYSGINSEGLTQVNLLQTRLQDIQAQLGWNEEEIETPEARRKITQFEIELREVAGRLLDTVFSKALRKDQSRFKATMKLDTENGDIQNTTDLTYAGTKQPVSLEELMYFGVEDWAKLFRGKISMDAAQAALPADAKFLLQYPIEKLAVIESDERYQMNLRLVGSDAELNERVVAFSDLASHFVSQAPALNDNFGVEIPADILAMIETKGLTPEVMQQLEDSNVSADTLTMLRQFQEMSKQLK